MSKSKVQIFFEYLLARSLVAFFGLLPLRVSMRAGEKLAGLSYHLGGRLRRTGRRNLELAFPDLTMSGRDLLLRGCFENLGRLLGVFSHFKQANQQILKQLIEVQGLEHLDAAGATGRGVILFTGHIGAWELSSFGLSVFGRPLSFLVRRLDNPKVESLIDRWRTARGNRTIDKRSAAREILRILQRGGTAGILVDLNTQEHEAIFVDFFGIKAATTFVVAKLALRTNSLVLPVFAPWQRDTKTFLLKIDPPLNIARSGDEPEDVRRLTQALTSVVEDYVRRYPEQWLWIHRRWKTRPPGEPEIYQ
jgi:KDO2-lipid IV(A) lauroyltransferase